MKPQRLKALAVEVMAWQIPRITEGLPLLPPLLDEWATVELIGMLRAMRTALPGPLASAFARHRSAKVREAAARHILELDPDNIPAVAHLAADPEPKIRAFATPRLVKRRDPLVEGVLLEKLSQSRAAKENRMDILEYYRAFGMAAGFRSVGFLSEILLKRDWGSLFRYSRDYHRTGAAMALLLMPATTGAEEVVRKAAKSAFRAVRGAVEEARKMLDKPEAP